MLFKHTDSDRKINWQLNEWISILCVGFGSGYILALSGQSTLTIDRWFADLSIILVAPAILCWTTFSKCHLPVHIPISIELIAHSNRIDMSSNDPRPISTIVFGTQNRINWLLSRNATLIECFCTNQVFIRSKDERSHWSKSFNGRAAFVIFIFQPY